jgi:hypothetical protein
MEMTVDNERLMTREQLAGFLTESGYPIARGTLDQYATKKIGPPVEQVWGQRPLYSPSKGLAWAKARARKPEGVA